MIRFLGLFAIFDEVSTSANLDVTAKEAACDRVPLAVKLQLDDRPCVAVRSSCCRAAETSRCIDGVYRSGVLTSIERDRWAVEDMSGVIACNTCRALNSLVVFISRLYCPPVMR